ncbi:MAG TPA: Asp-tRNA(Asn)/Glu-tRNA(Gln) amidotransferase subunit GatB [Bacillota bacterium]|nr:Asp-tRNA(Asn)/Glu-tRNA(Gln) amidotransferase subunit GatB [Bacillota bacterium]
MYEAVIGLEVHVELLTRTKLFCRCSTQFGAPPNSQVCPVCLGLPGALPVLNGEAVDQALKAAAALNCRINRISTFARKHYFYPDQPKGYQITQTRPLAEGGRVDLGAFQVNIARLHLEEDAGKSIHTPECTLVDYNRSGIPLIEIVTEPCLRTPAQAREFLEHLRLIMEYAGISDCKMEEGSLRCDANISLRGPGGSTAVVEIKNLNSFRAMERALAYEIRRQSRLLAQGKAVAAQTLRWDEAANRTVVMRSKEEAGGYRYLPEPDLPPLILDEAAIARACRLPELPLARKARFIGAYGLSEADAHILIGDRMLADWFEAAVAAGARPRPAANWVLGEVARLRKETRHLPFTPADLARLIDMTERGAVSVAGAKKVLAVLAERGGDPEQIVHSLGLAQVSDREQLAEVARQAVAENPDAVRDYRSGKDRALRFLLGKAMKLSRGRANPQLLRELVLQAIADAERL